MAETPYAEFPLALSRIRILPEALANQIAAGEVIERPASVVKELLENAIDAGAGQIEVQIEDGGTRLIRLIDDGSGMDRDDVLLCLERHATSKIGRPEELQQIRTLGFRGEAVPSIASVSRLSITSRPAAEALGVRAEIRFGRVIKVHEMGAAPGTSFEVADLFGNVPARKKFLKSQRTELAHIEEVLRAAALARPTLGLGYQVDGRELLRLPAGADSPQSRTARILSCPADQLLVVGRPEDPAPALHGFLLRPDSPVSARFRIFVNGRSIQDRMICQAVTEGMQNFLMKGNRPAGVLFLDIPPDEVDVNVHPTKQEVRFARPAELHRLIVATVRRTMGLFQEQTRIELFRSPPGSPQPAAHRSEVAEAPAAPGKDPSESVPKRYQPDLPLPAPVLAESEPATALLHSLPQQGTACRGGAEGGCQPEETNDLLLVQVAASETAMPASVHEPARSPHDAAPCDRLPPRYLGQLHNTYLLCQTEDGLLVVDQHAAHERLLFEKLKAQFAARAVSRQALLFPKLLECSLDEVQILERYAEEIAALGVSIEEFGSGGYLVKAVPAILGKAPVEEIMAGIFARFAEPGSRSGGIRAEGVLADLACKAAVKAGQHLIRQEAEALLFEMERAAIFSHCPHGRPVTKIFSIREIERWFYRG